MKPIIFIGIFAIGGTLILSPTAHAQDDLLVGEQLISLDETNPTAGSGATRPTALFRNARNALTRGNYASAQADFQTLIQKFPKHKNTQQAYYWLGETYYVQNQYKKAAMAFLDGYAKAKKSPKAPDSLLKLGITLTTLGETKTACQAFKQLEKTYPKADAKIQQRTDIEKQRAKCP